MKQREIIQAGERNPYCGEMVIVDPTEYDRLAALYALAFDLNEIVCEFLNDEKPFAKADAAVIRYQNWQDKQAA